MNNTTNFFKHQLFLAGLSDSLCDKVLEAKKDTFTMSLEFAWELEAIQLDHKCSQKIADVKAKLQPEDAKIIAWDDLIEEEIKQAAAMQAHSNKFPPKKYTGRKACSNNQARSNRPGNPNIPCHYSQKIGHLQKECHSCHHDNTPMVDANCKPLDNCVNNMAEKQENWDTNQKYKDTQVGAVTKPVPPFKLVSNTEPTPTQSCSPANIENEIQSLYSKLMNNAVNEIKKHFKAKFLSSLFVVQCTKLDLSARPLPCWSRQFLPVWKSFLSATPSLSS